MQYNLKEAILLNVPVALGNEEPCHKSMLGLDQTARWDLLTQDKEPVPELHNLNQQHRPPTEMGPEVNRK